MEKLLIMNNSSICHNVFKSRIRQRQHKASIYGKGERRGEIENVNKTHSEIKLYFNTHVFFERWYLKPDVFG